MDDTQVTPDRSPEAAARIEAAVRDGAVRNPPVPIGGAGYGHDRAAWAVAQFGRTVQRRTAQLVAEAERAAAGLRGGADAYLADAYLADAYLTEELRAVARLMGLPRS